MIEVKSLTLVLNPNARKPRLEPPALERLKECMGSSADIHVTKNLDELDALMRDWDKQEETLCFYGGDGSIARGLTSLIRHQGENYAIPPLLAVRAGTMNMLCGVLGLKDGANAVVDQWRKGELPVLREIPLLKVEVEDQPPQYGFVFSWGVGFRVLREYYVRGNGAPSIPDAVVVVAKAFLSALHPNAGKTKMFRKEPLHLKIDERRVSDAKFYSLTVGTITRVSLGIRPFAPEPVLPGGFHVSANGMSLLQMARRCPTLLFAYGDQRELARDPRQKLVSATQVKAMEAELSEGFTIDGEMFELPRRSVVRITAGPTVRFWAR